MEGSIPLVSGVIGRKDAKQAIIEILGREWPLTAKQVFSKVKAEGGREITYQGVHKALRQLAEQGIVRKAGSAYSLDVEWIRKLKQDGEKLELAYSGAKFPSLKDLREGQAVAVNFPNIISIPYWAMKELSEMPTSGKVYYVMHMRYVWPAMMLGDSNFATFKEMMAKYEKYLLVANDTKMDRLCAKFFQGFGSNVRLGVPNIASGCDFLVCGDYVMQFFWPGAFQKEIGAIYADEKHDGGEVLRRVYKIVFEDYGRTEIPSLITRNRQMARRITEETLAYFKPAGKGK